MNETPEAGPKPRLSPNISYTALAAEAALFDVI
jgi:hypothetical protein